MSDIKPLILVVDDFPDNREMYADYVRFVGYRVAEAANVVDDAALDATVMR